MKGASVRRACLFTLFGAMTLLLSVASPALLSLPSDTAVFASTQVSEQASRSSPVGQSPGTVGASVAVGESGAAGESRTIAERRAAAEIRAVYETSFDLLPADKQRHYAQRLWRVTGDPAYLCANHAYGRRLLDQLARDAFTVAGSDRLRQRNRELLAAYPETSPKQRRRKAMLSEHVDMMLPRGILFRLAQARYHGLLGQLSEADRRLLEQAVGAVDWRAFLTDPEVVSVYAAQVANQAAFLAQLGIVDLRGELARAFRDRYPPGRIEELSPAEYRNWVYGLTHFIIAASHYYQRMLSDGELDWAVAALLGQGEALVQVKADIIAEVALSLQLAGQADHPLVAVLHEALLARRDPQSGILPATDGGFDLGEGEHRNVLAIMTLGWDGRLYSGPRLVLKNISEERDCRLPGRSLATSPED